MNYDAAINNIEQPDGKKIVIKNYQTTRDIIKDLIYCFKHYNQQAQPLVGQFKTGDTKTDAKRIYDFIKNNIEYQEEPAKDQTTQSFSAILHNKKGDCKHTALLASSLAWQMGYNVFFKFVSYYPGETYGHVYTLIQKPGENKKYIIDTLQDFNTEKPYIKALTAEAKNQKSKNMTLTRITGNGSNNEQRLAVRKMRECRRVYNAPGIGAIALTNIDEMGKIDLKKAVKKVVQAPKKVVKALPKAIKKLPEKIKDKVVTIKNNVEAKGGIVKVVALAPVRAAGLALFLVNFRNFAGRFVKLPVADQQAFAKKFGYDYSKLMDNVKKGATKKPVFGNVAGVGMAGDVHYIEGVGSVSIAATIAAAAPLVLALVNTFKDKGLAEGGDTEATKSATEGIKDILAKTDDLEQTADATQSAAEGGGDTAGDGFFDKLQASVKEKPVLWIGGAGITLYALNKKFKWIK